MLIREGLKRSAGGVAPTLVGPTCSTGYESVSGADVAGAVIDLQSGDWGGVRYRTAALGVHIYSTVGSTEADTKLTVSLRLQHGDSSGGGGMTDYSTAFQPVDEVFGTTFNSTAMSGWSTAIFSGGGQPNGYDLRAAKRYIKMVVKPTINDQSTSTTPGKTWKRLIGLVTLGAPDQYKEGTPRGAFTTATATST